MPSTECLLRSIEGKCRAAGIVVREEVGRFRVAVEAGKIELHAPLGPDSHDLEVSAGVLIFDKNVQKDLRWRIEAKLGKIHDFATRRNYSNPYTDIVGSGKGNFNCQLGVGDVTIL